MRTRIRQRNAQEAMLNVNRLGLGLNGKGGHPPNQIWDDLSKFAKWLLLYL